MLLVLSPYNLLIHCEAIINMENSSEKCNFEGNKELNASTITVGGIYDMLLDSINHEDTRSVVRLGRVDPTDNPLFRTTTVAVDAITRAVHSFNFNCYPPTVGLPEAKRAVADHLTSNLPHKIISPENVFLTIGGTQAIDIILPSLARPGANILLPKPGYPHYELRATRCLLEIRHFDLLPERGWEVDLDSLEALADENTVAIVFISPSSPCGNVFTYEHLKRVAEIASKLGIFVISDEVYAHVTFGSKPFVPMREFSSIVPVITIGSFSKRWFIPGWRIGWIALCDPQGIFQKTGIVTKIIDNLEITSDPTTIVQASIPGILEKTTDDFHSNNLNILREAANIFYDGCKEIPCLTCPHKPEGAMVVMVEINFSQLEGIVDDVQFCTKLAKEESVILFPGVAVGLKNWVRVSLAVDLSDLKDGLSRIREFSLRHAKMAIANYLSSDLPYQLSPENVFLTIGGTQAIDIILPVLARPGANILLPRPGYPQYDSRASCCLLEVAEISRKLGIFVIFYEIYAPVTYGNNPFVPMGVFSSIVPVITIGSLSKRWLVPGWRTGWIATCDPHGIFQKTGVVKKIISYLEITIDPPTFLQLVSLQAAIPEILGKTKDEFLSKNLNILRGAANIFYDLCKEILCLTCPHKPVGAMCVMVEINFSQIKDIVDEMDFCAKLAEEESVLLPGVTVGLKNWLRISFAVHTSNLVEGLNRIKAFCLIYAKMPRSYVSW
ncbi:putative aminotransferase TAT2 [Glycine soja]